MNDELNLLGNGSMKASEAVSGLFRRLSYGAVSLMSGIHTQWEKGEFRRKVHACSCLKRIKKLEGNGMGKERLTNVFYSLYYKEYQDL